VDPIDDETHVQMDFLTPGSILTGSVCQIGEFVKIEGTVKTEDI